MGDILQTVEDNNKLVPIGTLADCQDNVAKWWSAVLLASANTMLDQEDQEEEQQKLHKIIECVPYKVTTKTSKSSNEKMGYENKLANVIKDTMESYRMIGYSAYTIRDQLDACDTATNSLEEATENLNQRQEEQYELNNNKDEKIHDDNFTVLKNGLLLCCDWRLRARTSIWQNEMGGEPVTSNFLSACQRDLNSLRRVSVGMMAGAAPGKTQQLLDKSLIQRNSARGLICVKDDKYVVTGEREHATALYMACKHLPPQLLSSPGERNGMLTEAARTLEKIGDKRSVDECYKLMKSLGTC